MSCFIPRKSTEINCVSDFGPTKCQVHLAKMQNINNMIARVTAGDMSAIRRGSFMDVSDVPDNLQEILNVQVRAMESYNALPDAVRRRWASPAAFLAALDDPETKKEFVKLGLAFERMPEGPIEVKVINPVTAKADETSTVSA